MVASHHGYDFIKRYSTDEIESIINECERKSLEILSEEEIKHIIDYIGL
jgi:hypothetical protein